MDGDGLTIAFSTTALNIAGGSEDTVEDVFAFEITDSSDLDDTSVNSFRVSSALSGTPNGASTAPGVSPEGGTIVFESTASNLVSGDTNARRDIFAADFGDPGSGIPIRRYSKTSAGAEANGHSRHADVTDQTGVGVNGSLVVYESLATNLVSGDTNAVRDVFETHSRPFKRGDANGNGFIDSDDAVYLFVYLFSSGPPPPCFDAADTDDDGSLTLTDVTLVDDPQTPPPYPNCGADFTVDTLTCGANGCF